MTAARIKALVWREWRIIRKGYLSAMIMLFMVAGFFWLIRLSMSVGNLAPIFGDSEILKEFGGLLYYSGTVLVAVVAYTSVSDVSVVTADLNANWLRYSFALPITPAARATSHYIIKLIKLAVGFGFAVLNGVLSAKVMHIPFTSDMVWFLTALLAAMILCDALSVFFNSQARTSAGLQAAQVKAMGPMIAAVMIVSIVRILRTPPEEASLDDMINSLREAFISHESILIPLSLIGIAGGLVLGWYFMLRHYRTHGDVNEKAEKGILFFQRKQKGGETS